MNTTNISSHGPKQLIGTTVNDNSIEFIYRADPMFHFSGPPMSDQPIPKIWKEIIKSEGGKLVIAEVIEGRYIPPQPESYVFD